MWSIGYGIAAIFGLLIGNFTTSLFYRLPRDISLCGFLSDKEGSTVPFCSHCGHKLRFYEFLPLLNWMTTLGKCRYCHQKIPYQYFILEILGSLLSCLCFDLFNGFTDLYILMFVFSMGCLLIILIYRAHKTVPHILIVSTVTIGFIYRVLMDHTVIYAVTSLSGGLILSMIIIKKMKCHAVQRNIIHIMALVSVWCIPNNIRLYIMMLLLFIVRILWRNFDIYSFSICVLFIVALEDALTYVDNYMLFSLLL